MRDFLGKLVKMSEIYSKAEKETRNPNWLAFALVKGIRGIWRGPRYYPCSAMSSQEGLVEGKDVVDCVENGNWSIENAYE